MKIMVDTDTTTASRLQILTTIASRYNLDVISYAEEDGKRGERMAMDAEKGDIAVTDDYDIAESLLPSVLAVVSPEGFIYSAANMNALFYRRFKQQKAADDESAADDGEKKAGGRKLSARAAARKEREEEQAFTSLILDLIAPIQ